MTISLSFSISFSLSLPRHYYNVLIPFLFSTLVVLPFPFFYFCYLFYIYYVITSNVSSLFHCTSIFPHPQPPFVPLPIYTQFIQDVWCNTFILFMSFFHLSLPLPTFVLNLFLYFDEMNFLLILFTAFPLPFSSLYYHQYILFSFVLH